MRIGITGQDGSRRSIDDLVAEARQFEEDGFPSYYLSEVFAVDAIEVMAIIGRAVPRIELNTAVISVYGRHPIVTAQQALTAQAATNGRFVLGLGLSHQVLVERCMGLSFDKPVTYMREYLSALVPLLNKRSCVVEGTKVRANIRLSIDERTAPPVLLGALGPAMLELAGEMTDGTTTFLVGTTTLRDFTIPTVAASAERAGRVAPRVAARLPICVTDDVKAARRRATVEYRRYQVLPSYRAMLDREGVTGPADVALIGDEETVARALAELDGIGVTDFIADRFGSKAERERTRELLKSLL